jgi:hypothetical protein
MDRNSYPILQEDLGIFKYSYSSTKLHWSTTITNEERVATSSCAFNAGANLEFEVRVVQVERDKKNRAMKQFIFIFQMYL